MLKVTLSVLALYYMTFGKCHDTLYTIMLLANVSIMASIISDFLIEL